MPDALRVAGEILSQVVLSMQLSFAIFPLMMFTSDPRKMGEFANPLWLKLVGYAVEMGYLKQPAA